MSDSHHYVNKLEVIVGAFFSLIVTFFMTSISTFHPITSFNPSGDDAVYFAIGRMMHHGLMVYRDLFDHKGPMLYIIYYLGAGDNSKGVFIWLICLISCGLCIFFCYLISRLSLPPLFSIIVSSFILCLLLRFPVYTSPEGLSIGCITVSIYIFQIYLKKGDISNIWIFVSGICCAICALLKPTTNSIWVVYCLAILCDCIINKKYQNIRKFVLLFSGGFFLIVLPIVLWLIKQNAFIPMLEDYIVFNNKYSKTVFPLYGDVGIWTIRRRALFFILQDNLFLLSATATLLIYIIKNEKKLLLNALALIFAFFVASISGNTFGQYYMPIIPLCVAPMAEFFSWINLNIKRGQIVTIIILMSILLQGTLMEVANTSRYILHQLQNGVNDEKQEYWVDAGKVIRSYTEKGDKIAVVGSYSNFYTYSYRDSASQFLYTTPISLVDETIMPEYYKQLANCKPALILVPSDQLNQDLKKIMLKYNYTYVDALNNPDDADNSLILLYRR